MFGKSVCILLSGKAGVGKTTSANMFTYYFSDRGYDAIKEAFATGVKKTAREGFGWDGQKDDKGRRLLQRIGFAGREYNEDVWVTSTLRRVEDNPTYPVDVVVVDDWRFPNEARCVRDNGLYSVYTIRIEAPEREMLRGKPEYEDVSETALDDYSFLLYIDNSGSMEELRKQVNAIADAIIAREDNFGGK